MSFLSGACFTQPSYIYFSEYVTGILRIFDIITLKLYMVGGGMGLNVMDPSEYCEIPISLTTPRDKAINNLFLNWLQCNSNMFPFLQKLIQQLRFGL
jgi:hypothetical protein